MLLLENVQRRATKLMFNDKSLSHAARLKMLNLSTLEGRREHGDMIYVHKMLKGFVDTDVESFFMLRKSK
jgi:hypothetical protein